MLDESCMSGLRRESFFDAFPERYRATAGSYYSIGEAALVKC